MTIYLSGTATLPAIPAPTLGSVLFENTTITNANIFTKNMSGFFSGTITGYNFTQAPANTNPNISVTSAGVLNVVGANRNKTYVIYVFATNATGSSSGFQEIILETTVVPPPSGPSIASANTTIEYNAYTYAVNTLFTGTITGYRYTSSPSDYGNVSITSGGALTIQGYARNTTYAVTVYAQNGAVDSSPFTVNVTETYVYVPPPPPPVLPRTLSGQATIFWGVGSAQSMTITNSNYFEGCVGYAISGAPNIPHTNNCLQVYNPGSFGSFVQLHIQSLQNSSYSGLATTAWPYVYTFDITGYQYSNATGLTATQTFCVYDFGPSAFPDVWLTSNALVFGGNY